MSSEPTVVAPRGMRLLWAILAGLLLCGCATRLSHPLPPRAALPAPPPQSVRALSTLILAPDTPEQQRYLALSALLGLTRAAGRFDDADRVLEAFIGQSPADRLARLAELWRGDNALFVRRYAEAERRYRAAIAHLEADHRRRGLEPRVLGHPLQYWLSIQLSTAIALNGRPDEAARLLETASRRPWPQRNYLRQLGAIYAWDARDRPLWRRLQERLPPAPQGRRQFRRAPVPAVRPVEAVGFKAPWEPRVAQAAGALEARARSFLLFALRGLRGGEPETPCGRTAGGYYYGVGSHGKVNRQGRDRYAVDFAAPGADRTPWGKGGFGIQIRAAAEGIAGVTYYGTATHRNALSRGPTPNNNQVILFHTPRVRSDSELVFGPAAGPGRSGRRLPQGLELSDAWDYRSSYLHLVGLAPPCPPGGNDGANHRCIPFPALVSTGQYVWRGSPLGYEDSAGIAWIDHLHFQINASCRAGGAPCGPDYPYRSAGKSVPLHLEGRELGAGDAGTCLESTNRFELRRDTDGDGLPDVLEQR